MLYKNSYLTGDRPYRYEAHSGSWSGEAMVWDNRNGRVVSYHQNMSAAKKKAKKMRGK